MSLLALKASIGGAPTLGEHHRDLGGQSGGGSQFTAIMSAMAAEDPQSSVRATAKGAAGAQDRASPSANTPKPQQSGSIDAGFAQLVSSALAGETAQSNARPATSKGAASAQDRASPSANTPKPQQSGSIDAGFAELVYSALAGETAQSNARPATTKDAASAQDRASPSEDPPKTQQSGPIDPGVAGLVYGALAAPVGATPSQYVPPGARENAVAPQSAAGSNSAAANAWPAVGGPLWRALEGGGTGVSSDQAPQSRDAAALAGVVDGPKTFQMAVNGDPSLGLSAIQSRTYLGVDSAAQSEARSPIWRSQARSPAQAAVSSQPGATPAVAADNAAPAPIGNETPPEKRPTSGRNGSQSVSAPDPSAEREPVAIGPSASSALANPGVNPVVTGIGPIAVDQLPETLATQASALTSPTTTSSDSDAAASVGSAQVVKELQIQLDPADLGAVSVKMRLTDGKLSVVMEVSKPSTLKAVEGERDAITDRLGSTAQSLESLIIKPTATSQTNAESNDAPD
ncbi:MAG TPA: flagellar hook-length control protein FliK, partial [Roseiarcus sp.]|nr:flagellar hook-length control protein FliK [Roseiarcus sp.]